MNYDEKYSSGMKSRLFTCQIIFLSLFLVLNAGEVDSETLPHPDTTEWWSKISEISPQGEAPKSSGLKICSDFKSFKPCGGSAKGSDQDSVIQNMGINFQGRAGKSVISPIHGTILDFYTTNECGGIVHILADAKINMGPLWKGGDYYLPVYLRVSHLTYIGDEEEILIQAGQKLKPGDLLGYIGSKTDRDCIGSVPNIHMEISITEGKVDNVNNALNLNNFWYDGPGLVTCFNEKQVYSAEYFAMVSPLICK